MCVCTISIPHIPYVYVVPYTYGYTICHTRWLHFNSSAASATILHSKICMQAYLMHASLKFHTDDQSKTVTNLSILLYIIGKNKQTQFTSVNKVNRQGSSWEGQQEANNRSYKYVLSNNDNLWIIVLHRRTLRHMITTRGSQGVNYLE